MREKIIYTVSQDSKKKALEELRSLLYDGSLILASYIRIPDKLFFELKKISQQKRFLKKVSCLLKRELGDSEIKIILDLKLNENNLEQTRPILEESYDYFDALTFNEELSFSSLYEIKRGFPKKIELIFYPNSDDNSEKNVYAQAFYNLSAAIKYYNGQRKTPSFLFDFIVLPEAKTCDQEYEEQIRELNEKWKIKTIKEKKGLWAIL